MLKEFSKYHGRGNDFILIDDRNQSFPLSHLTVKSLCQRHFGIGADGLILLQESEKADILMRIFNSDGHEAKSCGNGLLCLLTYAKDQKIIDKKNISIETYDRIVFASKEEDKYLIDMGKAKNQKMNHQITIDDKQLLCHLVDTGVQHAVVFVDDLTKVDIVNMGKKIRLHKDFLPEGVNVNFVEKINTHCNVRTFEKGVENQTFACGTGACAVGVMVSNLYKEDRQKIVFEKGQLDILISNDVVKMKGDATFVYSGKVHLK